MSGGGTPAFFSHHEVPELTEVRAGTYVYGDRSCIANGSVPLEDCALRVRATVASRPTPERGILDCGSKTLTNDPAEETDSIGRGLIVEYPEARIYALSEEHGHVDFSACDSRPEVGEVVTIVPNHACGCTNLHDEVVVHRGGRDHRVLAGRSARQAALTPNRERRSTHDTRRAPRRARLRVAGPQPGRRGLRRRRHGRQHRLRLRAWAVQGRRVRLQGEARP